jgi:hypothetical protein
MLQAQVVKCGSQVAHALAEDALFHGHAHANTMIISDIHSGMSPTLQEWELDWGALVPNRTANQARRRWTLMLKHVENVNDKEFTERLLTLVGYACSVP